MIPLPSQLILSAAKILLPALLAAATAASCTGKHYRLKIENIELQFAAAVKDQEAAHARQVASLNAASQAVSDHLQNRVAELDSRYRDAAARLHNAAKASRASMREAAGASVLAAAPAGDGLPDGSGEAAAVAPALLVMPVDGTVELLRQCDLNTQKLQGWQLWYKTIGETYDNPQ